MYGFLITTVESLGLSFGFWVWECGVQEMKSGHHWIRLESTTVGLYVDDNDLFIRYYGNTMSNGSRVKFVAPTTVLPLYIQYVEPT